MPRVPTVSTRDWIKSFPFFISGTAIRQVSTHCQQQLQQKTPPMSINLKPENPIWHQLLIDSTQILTCIVTACSSSSVSPVSVQIPAAALAWPLLIKHYFWRPQKIKWEVDAFIGSWTECKYGQVIRFWGHFSFLLITYRASFCFPSVPQSMDPIL